MWCFWEFLFLLNHYVTLASWFLTLAFLLGLVFVFFNDWFFPIDSKTMFLFCANLLNIVSCVGLFLLLFFFVFLLALVRLLNIVTLVSRWISILQPF